MEEMLVYTGKVIEIDKETLSGTIERYDGKEVMFFAWDLEGEDTKALTLDKKGLPEWEEMGEKLGTYEGKRVVFRVDETVKLKRATKVSALPERRR